MKWKFILLLVTLNIHLIFIFFLVGSWLAWIEEMWHSIINYVFLFMCEIAKKIENQKVIVCCSLEVSAIRPDEHQRSYCCCCVLLLLLLLLFFYYFFLNFHTSDGKMRSWYGRKEWHNDNNLGQDNWSWTMPHPFLSLRKWNLCSSQPSPCPFSYSKPSKLSEKIK